MDVGERITALRAARGWSMNRLAQEADVAQSYISDIEKGKAKPTVEIIERICGAFGVSLRDFLTNHSDAVLPSSNLDVILREYRLWFDGEPVTEEEKIAALEGIRTARKVMGMSKAKRGGDDTRQ